MSSYSDVAPRRLPQQTRGQKRVSALLCAASEVLAQKGYEAATMSEIAERAHASIGSLYQFFPNKESIACALHTQCGQDVEQLWAPLLAESPTANFDEVLGRLIEVTVHYIDTHPALVALQQAPRSTWNENLRRRMEQRIVRFFLSNKPSLDHATAAMCGSVSLRIIRACSQQCLESNRAKRKRIVSEYKILLKCYVTSRQKDPNAVQ